SPARHGAWVIASRDGGRTFEAPHLIAQDPANQIYYWDQRLAEAGPNGEYIALFWTYHREQKKDRNVFFLRGSLRDDSAARKQPRDTGIPGQIAAPLLLEHGRILGFVVNRDRPGTMTLWQSRDGGKTWPAAEKLVVHEQQERAALTQGKENIDFAQYWE